MSIFHKYSKGHLHSVPHAYVEYLQQGWDDSVYKEYTLEAKLETL